jgi:hypothetical protein
VSRGKKCRIGVTNAAVQMRSALVMGHIVCFLRAVLVQGFNSVVGGLEVVVRGLEVIEGTTGG